MKVGINLLYLLPGLVGGTETYAAGLLHGLATIDDRNEYVVFVNRESADWTIPKTVNFSRVVCPVQASSRARRYLFEQVRLSRLLGKNDIDIVHSLGYVGPLHHCCSSVVSLPDLNYFDIGHTMSFLKRHVLRLVSTCSVRRAKVVVTISEFSKDTINRKLSIPRDKIVVTLLGPGLAQTGTNYGMELVNVRKKYSLEGPYLIAFGGGAKHKNIPRLLEAYAGLRGRHEQKLVLMGHLPPDMKCENLPEGVKATGYVPVEDVPILLGGAEAFVLPSLYEGFGLPVLEAQRAGVPVVCSTAGSLPEVAGEGAVYFDPLSVEDMVCQINRVLGDPALREDLRQKGQTNVGRFSWEKTARETLAVYERVFSIRRTP